MPLYQWKSEDGDIIERTYHMNDERPEIIVLAGPRYFYRVYGNCNVDDRAHCDYPYGSLRLKGRIGPDDAEHKTMTIRGNTYDDVPVIRNKQHEAELCAKHGLVRE